MSCRSVSSNIQCGSTRRRRPTSRAGMLPIETTMTLDHEDRHLYSIYTPHAPACPEPYGHSPELYGVN
ncbi:hypothetical protein AALO_G00165780 [Alosa alosa]|uniref:Uncharacterized protein n=1 Tax=Alosa alosa TaxID=278164 RepID=A0AAV6GFW8_9TELE|nr:hypothetical protein AALO_G00165780 [Alosa alosa]